MAACRSIPLPRVFSSSGPCLLSAMARSTARPTDGGSGTWTTRLPLPITRRTRWPCSSTQVEMFGLVRLEDPQPEQAEERGPRRSRAGWGERRAAVRSASNCSCVRPRVGDSGGDARSSQVLGRGMFQDGIDEAGAVEPRHTRGHGGTRWTACRRRVSCIHRTYSSRSAPPAASGSRPRARHQLRYTFRSEDECWREGPLNRPRYARTAGRRPSASKGAEGGRDGLTGSGRHGVDSHTSTVRWHPSSATDGESAGRGRSGP